MTESIAVVEASQVAEARRRAAALAAAHGLDDTAEGHVAIVATELATNLIKHGGGGELLLQARETAEVEIEIVALDKGRGIADIDACLRDGHSTAGSAGTGLGAISRLSRACEIYSRPGAGTAILARVAADAKRARPSSAVLVGGVNVPMPGEVVCGDAWCLHREEGSVSLLVSDGLGHGPLAAEASRASVAAFQSAGHGDTQQTIARIHAALRATRGAVVAVARIDYEAGQVSFCGIGNIAGVIGAIDGERRMVSMNGTAGAAARKIQAFHYPLAADAVVILASDGLSTSWTLDRWPGLLSLDPTLAAAILYRDLGRGRDDSTVVVVRQARP